MVDRVGQIWIQYHYLNLDTNKTLDSIFVITKSIDKCHDILIFFSNTDSRIQQFEEIDENISSLEEWVTLERVV